MFSLLTNWAVLHPFSWFVIVLCLVTPVVSYWSDQPLYILLCVISCLGQLCLFGQAVSWFVHISLPELSFGSLSSTSSFL